MTRTFAAWPIAAVLLTFGLVNGIGLAIAGACLAAGIAVLLQRPEPPETRPALGHRTGHAVHGTANHSTTR